MILGPPSLGGLFFSVVLEVPPVARCPFVFSTEKRLAWDFFRLLAFGPAAHTAHPEPPCSMPPPHCPLPCYRRLYTVVLPGTARGLPLYPTASKSDCCIQQITITLPTLPVLWCPSQKNDLPPDKGRQAFLNITYGQLRRLGSPRLWNHQCRPRESRQSCLPGSPQNRLRGRSLRNHHLGSHHWALGLPRWAGNRRSRLYRGRSRRPWRRFQSCRRIG